MRKINLSKIFEKVIYLLIFEKIKKQIMKKFNLAQKKKLKVKSKHMRKINKIMYIFNKQYKIY